MCSKLDFSTYISPQDSLRELQTSAGTALRPPPPQTEKFAFWDESVLATESVNSSMGRKATWQNGTSLARCFYGPTCITTFICCAVKFIYFKLEEQYRRCSCKTQKLCFSLYTTLLAAETKAKLEKARKIRLRKLRYFMALGRTEM